MNKQKGAMTLAEGHPKHRTDVDIMFRNGKDTKHMVLRTTKDEFAMWKTKHHVAMAGFRPKNVAPQKWAARIDNDYWVFGVDGTKAVDIFAAVKIGMDCYRVSAVHLLSEIYVKNLNADMENDMGREALIRANQKLYEGVGRAIKEAAKLLGVNGIINLHVFSNKKNHKIPAENLQMALRDGGADSVETDEETKFRYDSQSNDGQRVFSNLITHMHLAKFRV